MPSEKPQSQFIENVILEVNSSSVQFASLSPYNKVDIFWTARSTTSAVTRAVYLRIGSDTTAANYRMQYIQGNSTTVTGLGSVSQSRGATLIGICSGSSATAGLYGAGTISLVGWNAPHTNFLGITFNSGVLDSTTTNSYVRAGSGVYTGAGPYTSLTILPQDSGESFVSGSQFTLVGYL